VNSKKEILQPAGRLALAAR